MEEDIFECRREISNVGPAGKFKFVARAFSPQRRL